jgi:hypothetical protein
MNGHISLRKQHAWTMLLGSMALALLPSLAFGATKDLTLPVSKDNIYDLTAQTEGDVFKLFDAGKTYNNAWCVLNPSTQEEEASAQTLEIRSDEEAIPYLSFDRSTLSQEAFLALRIGTGRVEDGTYKPYALMPLEADINKIVPRALHITSRFEPSAELPSIDLLKKLYADRENAEALEGAVFYAAKMGLCVKDDGYFYIARVVADTDLSSGQVQSLTFEWAQTNVAYLPEPATPIEGVTYVGNGRVDVKVLSYAYRAAQDQNGFAIAYCLEVRKASDDPDAPYASLSEGLGYSWAIDDGGNGAYAIDFSSVGKGPWLFPLDGASVGTHENANGNMDLDTLESLNMVGFSASAGGLYKVELSEGTSVDNINTLAAAYNVGRFATFASLASPTFSLFADWVDRYDVNLSDHLSAKTRTYTMHAMYATDTGCATTEEAFNAFLLDMDPAANVTQKLTVTSVTPTVDEMVLTVTGPEGCSLKNALSRAGRLYIKRAATLGELSTAEALPMDVIDGASLAAHGADILVTLPRYNQGQETPFVQVMIDAVEE